jgi:hypothetical protein
LVGVRSFCRPKGSAPAASPRLSLGQLDSTALRSARINIDGCHGSLDTTIRDAGAGFSPEPISEQWRDGNCESPDKCSEASATRRLKNRPVSILSFLPFRWAFFLVHARSQ